MWYKSIRNQVFKKIILFYSTITVISLSLVATTSIILIHNNAYQNAKSKNMEALRTIENTLLSKSIQSKVAHQELYENQLYSSAVTSLLQLGPYDFQKHSLDQYLKTNISPGKELKKYISSIFNSDTSISSVNLYSNLGFIYSSDSNANVKVIRDQSSSFNHYFIEAMNNTSKSDIMITPNLELGQLSYIQSIQNPSTFMNIGQLIINFDIHSLIGEKMTFQNLGTYGEIILLDDLDRILYTSTDQTIPVHEYHSNLNPLSKGAQKSSTLNSISNFFEYEAQDYNLVREPTIHLNLLGIIKNKYIFETNLSTYVIIIIATGAVQIIVLSLALIFSSRYSKRLHTITEGIKGIRSGNMSARITSMKVKDELTEIAESFNLMCDHIEEYIETIYIQDAKKKSAELKFLQAQINPHFLYNTLEAIRMRAAVQGAIDVSEMIYILATFFRNSLGKEMITTLEQEIDHCLLYLKLFQIRYPDRLTICLSINPKLNQYSIIKLCLQPLVENCIIHGFDMDKQNNCIRITAFELYNDIMIKIEDNGKGIDTDALKKVQLYLADTQNSDSIGITNVQERIKRHYGPIYGLTVESALGVGTTVTIRIPARKKGEL